MSKIKETYEALCKIPSDINEHLPTLYRYALMCDCITEFGVRNGVSTWAFLAAKPISLDSYDFCRYRDITKIIEAADREDLSFAFHCDDVLDVDIEKTDLLFIDTFHHPLQLRKEFIKHADKVNKYIILHDTFTHRRINEQLWPDERKALQERSKSEQEYDGFPNTGIWPEIVKFLYDHNEWSIKEIYSNNNGLTILEKDAPCK